MAVNNKNIVNKRRKSQRRITPVEEKKEDDDEETILKDMEVEVEMEQLLSEKDDGVTQEGFASKKYSSERIQFLINLRRGLQPLRCLLIILGRFPFKLVKNEDDTRTYEPMLKSCHGIYFLFTSAIGILIVLIGTFNLVDMMFNFTFIIRENIPQPCRSDERLFEMAVFDRNILCFIIVMTALLHLTISSLNIYFKRVYMGKYLSHWEVAVQTMHIDVGYGLFKYTLVLISFIVLSLLLLMVLSIYRLSAVSIGGPTLFSILLFRLYNPCLLDRDGDPGNTGTGTGNEITKPPHPHPPTTTPPSDANIEYRSFTWPLTLFQVSSGILFLFIFLASKTFVLLFLVFCKMLNRAFESWNIRFMSAINRNKDFVQRTEDRTTYKLLFKDHCILLDLIEGTDRFIANSVESYFFLQLGSTVFEFYFLIRTSSYESRSNKSGTSFEGFIRPYDWVIGLIICLVNIIILFVVLKAAASVGENAIQGLDIIRNKTMMGRKHDQELYFMLSMFSSFTAYKRLALRGGGYLTLDKESMITILSVFATYLIVVYQFQPTMDYEFVPNYPPWNPNGSVGTGGVNDSTATGQRSRIAKFLTDLERMLITS